MTGKGKWLLVAVLISLCCWGLGYTVTSLFLEGKTTPLPWAAVLTLLVFGSWVAVVIWDE